MKRFILAFLAAAAAMCVSCNKPVVEEKMSVEAWTGEVSGITVSEATLFGRVTIKNASEDPEVKAYFYYAESQKTATELISDGSRIVGEVDGNEFSAALKDLKPQTHYWFVAVVNVEGVNYHGEVKDFTTQSEPVVPSLKVSCETLDAYDITVDEAELTGRVTIENAPEGAEIKSYFYYAESEKTAEALVSTGVRAIGSTIRKFTDGEFYVTLEGLKAETKYWFVAVVNVDGVDYPGEVKTFTTQKKPDSPIQVLIDQATSVGETSAVLNANIASDGDNSSVSAISFVLMEGNKEFDDASTTDRFIEASLATDGTISALADYLKQDTEYTYFVILTTPSSLVYSDVSHFRTREICLTTELLTTRITSVDMSGTIAQMADGYSSIENVYFLVKGGKCDLETITKGNPDMVDAFLGLDGKFVAKTPAYNPSSDLSFVACIETYAGEIVYGNVVQATTDAFDWVATDIEAGVSFTSASVSFKIDMKGEYESADLYVRVRKDGLDGYTDYPAEYSEEYDIYSAVIRGLMSDSKYYYTVALDVDGLAMCASSDEYTMRERDFVTGRLDLNLINVEFIPDFNSITMNCKVDSNAKGGLEECTVTYYISKDETTYAGIRENGVYEEKHITNKYHEGIEPSFTFANLEKASKYHCFATVSSSSEVYTSPIYTCSTLTPDINVSLNLPVVFTVNPTISGAVTATSGFKYSEVDACVVCLSTSIPLSPADCAKNSEVKSLATYNKSTGTYSADVSGLDQRKTYYVVTVVSAYGKSFYSDVKQYRK